MKAELSTQSLLLRLLYGALIDIRYRSHEENNAIYRISNLLHNLPTKLDGASKGERTYEDVLEWLYERAEEFEMTDWLKSQIEEAQQVPEL